MGNSRNLANLLGTGSTIATAKIADDAITSAKLADDSVVAAAIATNAVASDALNIVTADLPVGVMVAQNHRVYRDYYTVGTTNSSWAHSSNQDVTFVKRLDSSNVEFMLASSVGHWSEGNSAPQLRIGYKTGSHGAFSTYSFSNGYSGNGGLHGSQTRYGYSDDNHVAYVSWHAMLGNIGNAGTYYIRSFWTSETSGTLHFNRSENGWSHDSVVAGSSTSVIVKEVKI